MGKIDDNFRKAFYERAEEVSFCGECGAACCKWGTGVLLQSYEIDILIPRMPAENWDGQKILFLNDRCPFLSPDDKCTIYNERPGQCRFFSCVYMPTNADFMIKNPHVAQFVKEYWGEQISIIKGGRQKR